MQRENKRTGEILSKNNKQKKKKTWSNKRIKQNKHTGTMCGQCVGFVGIYWSERMKTKVGE